MASFRTFSEIVASMIERLKLSQPSLDTKIGSVSRDLFIDIQADQIERLYRSLAVVSEKQSLATATGRDLDRIAANFGISRKSATNSSGLVVFYTNTITNDIIIPNGTIVSARNGVTFRTIGEYNLFASQKNLYAANASRLKSALNIAGITSSYAIEVPIQASRAGKSGNVSALQVTSNNSDFNVGVINVTAMSGGSNREADTSFRSRILAIFSGSNTGTSNGYRNSALSIDGVLDTLVVEPGNSLMLRDGSETIELEGGSTRILNSGSGGKIDMYVLGRNVQEVSESYVFTDLSGTGNLQDDRNDIILGISNQDVTLTSEERRLGAFQGGSIPLQPVDSIVSITGSQSGALTEAFIKADGGTGGNYELVKDMNPETGGSPFGFDRIHFVSGSKYIAGENISRGEKNSADKLAYSDIEEIESVYRDVRITRENSIVSSESRDIIMLNHSPVVKVSRVTNNTTGETYSVSSQGLDSETGLNPDGQISISGSSLPSQTDTLSVDYTWRHFYDEYVDYYKSGSTSQFYDPTVSDSIDWSTSSGIKEEESVIEKTDDGLEYKVSVNFNISKVISIFKRDEATSSIDYVEDDLENSVIGLELDQNDKAATSISSIRTSSGLELYKTTASDGSISSRKVIMPSDSPAEIGDVVTVYYNYIELYALDNSDGSYSDSTIILPSDDVLSAADILETVDDIYLAEDPIFISYCANIESIAPAIALSSLPILGSETDNILGDSNGDINESSNQPVLFNFTDDSEIENINKYSPSRLSVEVSRISKPGKIKVIGTTLHNIKSDVLASNYIDGLTFDMEAYIKDYFSTSEISSGMQVARVNKVSLLNYDGLVEKVYDIQGYSINDSTFDSISSRGDTSIDTTSFQLPSTAKNSEIVLSSSDYVRVEYVVYVKNSFEELYFPVSGDRSTNLVFARIDTVSASSGFRDSAGNLSGQISIASLNQPDTNEVYYVDYNFFAPKEGERLVVKYFVNKLIADVTAGVENVRPITADVLVKEASLLYIDVGGKILVNEDSILRSDSIVQEVNNSVSNILNASSLGTIIDYSDVLSVITAISGVDSATISLFNESGNTGRRSFISALDNQSLAPGTVSFEAVSRKKFKID